MYLKLKHVKQINHWIPSYRTISLTCICVNECVPPPRWDARLRLMLLYSTSEPISKSCGLVSESSSAESETTNRTMRTQYQNNENQNVSMCVSEINWAAYTRIQTNRLSWSSESLSLGEGSTILLGVQLLLIRTRPLKKDKSLSEQTDEQHFCSWRAVLALANCDKRIALSGQHPAEIVEDRARRHLISLGHSRLLNSRQKQTEAPKRPRTCTSRHIQVR